MTMESMKVSRERAKEMVGELVDAGAEVYRWQRTIPDLSVWTYDTEYHLRTVLITEDRRAEEQVRAMLQGSPGQAPRPQRRDYSDRHYKVVGAFMWVIALATAINLGLALVYAIKEGWL